MRKPMSLLLSVAAFAAALAPLASTPAEARRVNGGAIAAGIILGTVAAAAIASSHRARASEVYIEDRNYQWRKYCARLDKRCRYGNDNACDQFEDECQDY